MPETMHRGGGARCTVTLSVPGKSSSPRTCALIDILSLNKLYITETAQRSPCPGRERHISNGCPRTATCRLIRPQLENPPPVRPDRGGGGVQPPLLVSAGVGGSGRSGKRVCSIPVEGDVRRSLGGCALVSEAIRQSSGETLALDSIKDWSLMQIAVSAFAAAPDWLHLGRFLPAGF